MKELESLSKVVIKRPGCLQLGATGKLRNSEGAADSNILLTPTLGSRGRIITCTLSLQKIIVLSLCVIKCTMLQLSLGK